MTDIQKPAGEEKSATEVPQTTVPEEKKAEVTPNAPAAADETVNEEKTDAVPVQPEVPAEDTEVVPANPASELPAEPTEPAKTQEDVTEKVVNDEVNAADTTVEASKDGVSAKPAVEEEVQPPAEDAKEAAPVEKEQAAPEAKPEVHVVPAPVAEVEPKVVEKEAAGSEPVVAEPVTSVVAEEKKDLPAETEPAEIEKPVVAEVKTVEPAAAEEVAEPKAEEQPAVPAPQVKEVPAPEAIEQPAEANVEKEVSEALTAQQAPTADANVSSIEPIKPPQKSQDGPAKTTVTLPPKDSSEVKAEEQYTEEYIRNNMPEGQNFEKVRQIFYAFDHDLSGNIAMCELADALRCCGLYVSQKEVHKLKLFLKLEHQRVVSFAQFYQFLKLRKKDSIERLTKAFMRFDKKNTGFIDTIELRRCLTTMGEALTESQVDNMLEGLDVNKDGMVEFQEFVDYMLSDQQV